MSLLDNIRTVQQNIRDACVESNRNAQQIKLVAATKNVEPSTINSLKSYGILYSGENKVQELLAKYDNVDSTIWHFIGRLQSNKVKSIIDKVQLIHSLDRPSLADEIQKCAAAIGKTVDVLIEINIEREQNKGGVMLENLQSLYAYTKGKPNIRIKGFMSVMPITASKNLYETMQRIFNSYKNHDKSITELSMGMSDDYVLAVQHGATIVRIGKAIFKN